MVAPVPPFPDEQGFSNFSRESRGRRTMKTRLMLCAMATTCSALAAATPARAQPLPGETLPAWTQVASSCVVDEESNGRYALTGPDFSYKGSREGGTTADNPPL